MAIIDKQAKCSHFWIIACLLYSGSAFAQIFDNDVSFYSSRPRQLFKSDDARSLIESMDDNDDVPYWSWQGQLSSRAFALELHGNALSFISGKRERKFTLARAFAFANQPSDGFDPRGAELFVKSLGYRGPDVICLESMLAFVSKAIPFREVYVLVSAPGRASLYRLTGRNASCSGLEIDARQDILIPRWVVNPPSSNRFLLEYFRLTHTGFARTGEKYAGKFLKPDQFDFTIDDRPR